jgi:MEMO1 family protein
MREVNKMAEANATIRKPAWAGRFYPREEKKLTRMIQNFFDESADVAFSGEIVGILAPHAGYEFSGSTAAAAYKALTHCKCDTVIILAPSHSEMFPGASVYNGQYYQTPLGEIPVNEEIAAKIASHSPLFSLSDRGHATGGYRDEHSLEVQLPFLQTALRQPFTIVPVLFQDYRLENCRLLSEAIAAAIDTASVLIVASSDLYHGYSQNECMETDAKTINGIQALNGEDFCIQASRNIYQACGAGPISAMLMAAKKMGANEVKIAAHTNSAQMTGLAEGWVVGYASALVTRPEAHA